MNDPLTVKPIGRGSGNYLRAIHQVLEVPFDAARPMDSRAGDLLAGAAEGVTSIDLLFGAFRGKTLVAPVLAIESKGHTALVLLPGDQSNPAAREGSEMALARLAQAAFARGTDLLQAVIPPECRHTQASLQAVGFHCITTLVYLVGEPESMPETAGRTLDWTWVSYRPEVEDLFCEALERSYVGSMDCPELTGIHTTKDVLQCHRSRRHFDPAHWWVALHGAEPVGILLLNKISMQPTLEIVYLGVSSNARGQGVADALMLRTAEVARISDARYVTLAVDERNVPARRMYSRWNYHGTLRRRALIATPDRIERC